MIKQTVSPSNDEVLGALDRILQSVDFRASDSISTFLRFIVQETLDGRQERIKAYTIAVHAFGRDTDFDPQTDTFVRVHARRLRRALQHYYLTAGTRDPVIIDVVPGTYVPDFRYKDRTNLNGGYASDQQENLWLHAENGHNPRPPADPSRMLGQPSVLVAPLDISDHNDELLPIADGLTEQIVVALARQYDVATVGPPSRSYWREASNGNHGLSPRLNADFILHGNLRKQAAKYRVTVQLAETGTHHIHWAETYDLPQEIDDLFELEERLGMQIASALADNFGAIPRALTRLRPQDSNGHFRAFEAVLRYYHYLSVLSSEAGVRAYAGLEQALQIAPDYPLLHACMADWHVTHYLLAGAGEEALVCADKHVRQALVLDPQCALAHSVQADLFRHKGHLAKFVDKAEYAISLRPGRATFVGGKALFLALAGEWERGYTLAQKALALNPFCPGQYHYTHVICHYRQGDFAAALTETSHFSAPEFYWDHLLTAAVLGQTGATDAAAAELAAMRSTLPSTRASLHDLMARMLVTEENVDMIARGLYKAGLDHALAYIPAVELRSTYRP